MAALLPGTRLWEPSSPYAGSWRSLPVLRLDDAWRGSWPGGEPGVFVCKLELWSVASSGGVRDSKVTGRRAGFRQVGVRRSAPAPTPTGRPVRAQPCKVSSPPRREHETREDRAACPAYLLATHPCQHSVTRYDVRPRKKGAGPARTPIVQRWLSSAGTTHEGDAGLDLRKPHREPTGAPPGASACRWGGGCPRT